MILRLQTHIVQFVTNFIAMSAKIVIKKNKIKKEHEPSIVNFDMNLSSNPIIESSENSPLVPTFSCNINTENSPSTIPIVT